MKFSQILEEVIPAFRLTATEFILTYASDYLNQISVGIITEEIERNWRVEKDHSKCRFDVAICHAHGDEEIEHDHFHVYMKYKGKKFNCTRVDAFDIKLDRPVYAFYYKEGSNKVGRYQFADEVDLVLDCHVDTCNLDHENKLKWYCQQINAEGGWKLITHAHPNICPKKNYGSSYDMLHYVTKQAISMRTNFDVDQRLAQLLEEKNKKTKREELKAKKEMKKNKIQELEYLFCGWLRDKILNTNLTREEIQKEIVENEEWNFMFLSKHYNYKSVLDAFFKSKPVIKPDPYYGIFYVPKKLYDYLIYLDNFVETWYTKPKECPKRPKSCFVSGMGECGKTSLFRAFGDCCYWCNIWNYDAYESKPAINLMDDYDGNADNKGNETKNNFYYLKPWFAGQQVVTISGKFKKQTTVANSRPLVFISNYQFNKRFPNEEDRAYLEDIGCTVVDIPRGFTLKEYPKTCRMDVLSMEWVEYDTRNTWWYRNKVLPTLPNESENIEPPSELECQITNNIHLLEDIDAEIEEIQNQGRPTKRRRYSF